MASLLDSLSGIALTSRDGARIASAGVEQRRPGISSSLVIGKKPELKISCGEISLTDAAVLPLEFRTVTAFRPTISPRAFAIRGWSSSQAAIWRNREGGPDAGGASSWIVV
jgi:hypothetical protein